MKNFSLWRYVPTLYFAEGLIYVLINSVSVIIYKNLGISNELIGACTSLLYLPWTIKMLWSPAVDIYFTKRSWLLKSQLLIAVLLSICGLTFFTANPFYPSLILFALLAFISATNDIATDGYYMIAFNKEQQASFVGIRVLFYRLAIIFAMGALVMFAGHLHKVTGSYKTAWGSIILGCAIIYLFFYVYHDAFLPVAEQKSQKPDNPFPQVKEAVVSYFTQDKIIVVLLFILLYRFGEGMLVKMSAPFMLDAAGKGGLALSNAQVGSLYGVVGMVSLITGGILGGWLIAKFGFKKCVWPMTIALNAPNLLYYYIAVAKPALWAVYPMVAAEQFGAGLGFMIFTIFLMDRSDPKFKTTHFAISTGLMGLGLMVPGMVSGYLQQYLGYGNFFLAVFFITVPPMVLIPFLPKPRN